MSAENAPPAPEARLNQLLQQGRFADAIALYRSLPGGEKRRPGLTNDYACALILTGELRAAVRVLNDVPYRQKTADIWNNLCATNVQLGNLEDARVLLDRALSRFPDSQALLLTKSRCLADLGKDDDAYEAALSALRAAEDDASLFTAGRAADRLHRYDEAIDYYRRALALNPEHGAAANNLNHLFLQTRRFAEAWDLAEIRMRSPANRALFRQYFSTACPAWTGGSLAGRRLHVIGDQGVGDQIMFAQFAAKLGGFDPEKVFVYLDGRLVDLFAKSFSADFDIEFTRFPPARDFDARDTKVALSSLPNYTARTESDFARTPFLTGLSVGEKFSAGRDRPVFGLSWWSSGVAGTDRSLDLPELAEALLAQDADFMSLQYNPSGAGTARLESLMGGRLIVLDTLDCTDDFIGMAETAVRLDGIVSIPNTTVHIAGAIGVPTGVLLPDEASWRYISEDDRMIWYGDHVRLFEVRAQGDLKARIASFVSGMALAKEE